MATLRLFASAREAAGVARVDIAAATVDELMAVARNRFGDRFVEVLATSRIWVNGGPADGATSIAEYDVVAVLPPVSGGAEGRGFALDEPFEPAPRPHLRLVPSPEALTADRRTVGEGSERPWRQMPRTGRPGSSAASRGGPPTSYDALARVPLPSAPVLPSPDLWPESDAETAVAVSEPLAELQSDPSAGATATSRPPLAVLYTTERPHGRLGIVWATVTGLALALGALPLALWLAVCAAVAALQTLRVWVARRERPLGVLTILVAAALPLAAASGLAAMNAVIASAMAAMFLGRILYPTRAPIRDVGLSLVIAMAIGLAAASAVYLRTINLGAPMFLLACAAAYDTGAYLVGTGAKSAWEGPVGGVAALVPLTLLAAVALEPPFQGGSPMMLGLVAAVLAPLGPLAGSALLGDRSASAPALRRLDSLLVMGPVWTFWAASLFR